MKADLDLQDRLGKYYPIAQVFGRVATLSGESPGSSGESPDIRRSTHVVRRRTPTWARAALTRTTIQISKQSAVSSDTAQLNRNSEGKKVKS